MDLMGFCFWDCIQDLALLQEAETLDPASNRVCVLKRWSIERNSDSLFFFAFSHRSPLFGKKGTSIGFVGSNDRAYNDAEINDWAELL